jgi:hypothetical protein
MKIKKKITKFIFYLNEDRKLKIIKLLLTIAFYFVIIVKAYFNSNLIGTIKFIMKVATN